MEAESSGLKVQDSFPTKNIDTSEESFVKSINTPLSSVKGFNEDEFQTTIENDKNKQGDMEPQKGELAKEFMQRLRNRFKIPYETNMKSFKSTGSDNETNEENSFKAMPGETMDKYMKRWMNRSKEKAESSSKPTPSYAAMVQKSVETEKDYEQKKTKANFRFLESEVTIEGFDKCLPIYSVRKASKMYMNTLFGYFLGTSIAFPVVQNYVKNVWSKYGLEKIMMNTKGFFFFKFTTEKGMNHVLEGGPWMIRKSPLFLNK